MDKLKEFQKYQFWVLLAVAMILPIVGWVMATSGLAKAAEDRTKVLKDLHGSIKNVTPEDPNQDWSQKLKEINQVQEAQVRLAWLQLYASQQDLMTWPKNVDPTVMGSRDLEIYRTEYKKLVESVRQIVKPLDDENGELLEESGRLVNLPSTLMPHPDYDWAVVPPTPKQVEAAQEDLWLLSALLKAIAATNKHATSQYDASVREIVEMYLRGGSPKSAGGSKSPSAAPGAMGAMGAMGAGGAAEMAKMMKSSMSRSGMDGGMGGVSGGRQIGIESVSFNPDDEFGEEVEEKDPKAASATVTAAPGAMGAMGPAGMMEAMAGGNRGGRNSSANMKRYVEEKTEWKTRGFYLEVIVDQRQVPQLLVELTNAEWPIRITRVHQADLNDETLVGGGSAGGMPGMPVGAGMGAGMGRGGASPEAAMRKMMGAGAMGGGRSAPSRRQSVDGEEAGGAARPMRSEMGGRSEGMSGLDDPMLVTLAVDGLFTIFNKPPEDKNPPAATNQQLPAMGADQQLPETPDAAATPTETEEPPAEATTAPAEATATETETEPVAEPAPAAGESAPEDQPTAPPAGDTPPTEEKAPPEPEN